MSPIVTALLYFLATVASLQFFRFDNGVAQIWLPGALLAARLLVLPRSEWPSNAVAGVIANAIAAGLFGLGWPVALPLSCVNVAEAIAAALVARRLIDAHWPSHPLELMSGCYLGIGLAVPVCSAFVGAILVHAIVGVPFESNFLHYLVGHSVGLILLLPTALAVAGAVANPALRPTRSRLLLYALFFSAMMALTFAVFGQRVPGFMLLPLVFAMLAGMWTDSMVALALPLAIAIAGGLQTWLGHGPIQLFRADLGDQLQAQQLYSAFILLCTLPVVAEQERRRHEIGRLANREQHYRRLVVEADDTIRHLTRAAFTDPLTGLANRRAFFDQMRASISRGDADCIAILDIDHFKQVNDRYGHTVGDDALCVFARTALQAVRASDCIARIGGEEFALLLRDTSIDLAEKICERLGQRIAETGIPVPGGEIRVTISTGIATLGDDPDAAFLAADRALYRAKNAGRSRLVVAA
ncbi:sensor domain-containing diguanylate cyclase [Novosphingobium sp. FKTRR1]|uniref:GGDEF domain-containing protein n=1 Tax=Novosphingobium sp. FKTRR1 TaxID=2879118 RepID=UPI001CF09936|nr:sensor domain-containing diguanylate cyclase [Novosphingobium sp. FKTRR1]